MSNTDTTPDDTSAPVVNAADATVKPAVARTAKIVMALIIGSLGWYLLSDRYAPYTSQARVQGYVVGVSPEVAGTVTKVLVSNNQEVQEGDALFEIDPSQYQICLLYTSDAADDLTRVYFGWRGGCEKKKYAIYAWQSSDQIQYNKTRDIIHSSAA